MKLIERTNEEIGRILGERNNHLMEGRRERGGREGGREEGREGGREGGRKGGGREERGIARGVPYSWQYWYVYKFLHIVPFCCFSKILP